jgi:predicted nuclease of predicted toxin-antitoxin system
MHTKPTLFIRLYVDEDVHESVTPALRRHGYNVLNVREANRRGLSDTEQLAYATAEGRTLFSFNAADYIALHLEYLAQGQEHAGIVISKQIPISETVHRLLILLDQVSAGEIRNQLRWLPPL